MSDQPSTEPVASTTTEAVATESAPAAAAAAAAAAPGEEPPAPVAGAKRKRTVREICDDSGHCSVTVTAVKNLWNHTVEHEVLEKLKEIDSKLRDEFDEGALTADNKLIKKGWIGIPVGKGNDSVIAYSDKRFEAMRTADHDDASSVLGQDSSPFRLRFYNLHYENQIAPFVRALMAAGHEVGEIYPRQLAGFLKKDCRDHVQKLTTKAAHKGAAGSAREAKAAVDAKRKSGEAEKAVAKAKAAARREAAEAAAANCDAPKRRGRKSSKKQAADDAASADATAEAGDATEDEDDADKRELEAIQKRIADKAAAKIAANNLALMAASA